MACYKSITAWRKPAGGPIHMQTVPPGPEYERLQLPCSRCIGCRMDQTKQWATRCVLEASQHEKNSFITLTYSDEHLPKDLSLNKNHMQMFFDRLRKKKGPFRYYSCGEYGDITKRAHYHACLFGMDFEDKIPFQKRGDYQIYISAELTQLWGMGHCSITDVNYQTAAYCARYVMKKRLSEGKKRADHFMLEEQTGELIPVQHPYSAMSLRPAIALGWLQKFHGDIYDAEKDFLAIQGRKLKPPKYFDRIFDTIDPAKLAKTKERRKNERIEMTEDELRAHEKRARAKLLKRSQI